MSDTLESLVRDNVKNNPFLFDKGHPDYVNTKMKRETWQKIAFLIGEEAGIELNGEFVESMWQELKAKYKKMMTALKNHNSGRNTAPQNVDYNFIDAIHPGIIVNARDVGKMEIAENFCIIGICNKSISFIKKNHVRPLASYFEKALSENEKQKGWGNFLCQFEEALIEISKCINVLSNYKIACHGWQSWLQADRTFYNRVDALTFFPYPESIDEILWDIYLKETTKFYSSPVLDEKPTQRNSNNINIKNLNIQSFCISCSESNQPLRDHPIFESKLCNSCYNDFQAKCFALDGNYTGTYCYLCGSESSLLSCQLQTCHRKICSICINSYKTGIRDSEIKLFSIYKCLFCKAELSFFAISLQPNWKINEWKMLNQFKNSFTSPFKSKKVYKKKKIRVFSVCDGISAGMEVLDKSLGIDVDTYYATEIDETAKIVTTYNYGDKVVQLGNLKNITEGKIEALCPIDLLIGGTPCQDLSQANPTRNPFAEDSHSRLFFYYVKVKHWIEKHNRPHNVYLYWMFEKVSSMPSDCCALISEYLERQPIFIDSVHFSCMHRPRLYWGNTLWSHFKPVRVFLQDKLSKNCYREAKVLKLRTITRQGHSLLQGPDNIKAVMVNGVPQDLWITEIEEIFGFTKHYTGIANLSKNARLGLIGNSWSIDTVKRILFPLTYYFKLK